MLTVGAVGLRKGSPYVGGVSRLLAGEVEFRMVGPLELLPEAQKKLAASVELTGPIPRSEMRKQFEWADVFLLPSLCEGSAISVYEALAAGLPVICTENTGSVVRNGIDGYIVPIRMSWRQRKSCGNLQAIRQRWNGWAKAPANARLILLYRVMANG